MAYLRDIVMKCQAGGCAQKASVELINTRNAALGSYCRPCAKRLLKAQVIHERTPLWIS